MRKILFLLFVVMIGFTSCQKEIDDYIGNGTLPIDTPQPGSTDTSSNSIIGTWDFIKLSAVTTTSSVFDADGATMKIDVLFNYTSINNSGKITFTDSTMASSGLTYGVNDSAITNTYRNDTLLLTLKSPVSLELPATSSTASYKRISSDSLYFPDGGLTVQSSVPTIPTGATGAKISFSGDTLILKQILSFDTVSSTDNGVTHNTGTVIGNIYLKKH